MPGRAQRDTRVLFGNAPPACACAQARSMALPLVWGHAYDPEQSHRAALGEVRPRCRLLLLAPIDPAARLPWLGMWDELYNMAPNRTVQQPV